MLVLWLNIDVFIILNTGNRLPKIFKNRKEVGIRVPDNNIIREICHILKAQMCIRDRLLLYQICIVFFRPNVVVIWEIPHTSA